MKIENFKIEEILHNATSNEFYWSQTFRLVQSYFKNRYTAGTDYKKSAILWQECIAAKKVKAVARDLVV
ncbi:MAG: hypothetical protein GY870_19575 [archaeon]|nr:hypothetical protein [archaeon]